MTGLKPFVAACRSYHHGTNLAWVKYQRMARRAAASRDDYRDRQLRCHTVSGFKMEVHHMEMNPEQNINKLSSTMDYFIDLYQR